MTSLAIAEGSINWNGGQRITLKAGDTAQCTTLQAGQLYGIFIYNSAQNDNNATVNVVWSNSSPPVPITVSGSTGGGGPSSMGFVSGTDTRTISVSLPANGGLNQVEIWLGSVSMPTNTNGLINKQLPADGKLHEYDKYRRYFAVPATRFHQLTINSPVTQFISCQFRQAQAIVYVVNESLTGLLPGQIQPMGPTASAAGAVSIETSGSVGISKFIQGDGAQFVWMNSDSQQNSDASTISLAAI